MNETLEITTEQINDLPLLLGIVDAMGIRPAIDVQIRPHGHWQGLSVGTVVASVRRAQQGSAQARQDAARSCSREPRRGTVARSFHGGH